jgi:hypothetical protein
MLSGVVIHRKRLRALVGFPAFFRNLPVAALKTALKMALKTAVMELAITLIVTPQQQTSHYV